jgi:hypothetical protein
MDARFSSHLSLNWKSFLMRYICRVYYYEIHLKSINK